MQRIKLYSQIATNLSALSNEKLKQILADGKPMHEGIGGKMKLIQRRAYGFRNFENYRLRIRVLCG